MYYIYLLPTLVVVALKALAGKLPPITTSEVLLAHAKEIGLVTDDTDPMIAVSDMVEYTHADALEHPEGTPLILTEAVSGTVTGSLVNSEVMAVKFFALASGAEKDTCFGMYRKASLTRQDRNTRNRLMLSEPILNLKEHLGNRQYSDESSP